MTNISPTQTAAVARNQTLPQPRLTTNVTTSWLPKLARQLAAALVILAGASLPALACSPPPGAAELQSKLGAWINSERTKVGLNTLTLSPELGKAAQVHACDMIKRQFYAHQARSGPSFKNRLKRAGYRMSTAVENLGRSTEYSLEAPIRMWKNSPEHHVNTVNPNIREMGLGLAVEPNGRAYYVFIGGAPR